MKLALTLAALVVAMPAAAQNIDLAHMTGQPLQYMEGGELDGCGLRVMAARPLSGQRVEWSEVSVNVHVDGRTVFKALAYAPGLVTSKTMPREVRVETAWAKAPGSAATAPLQPAFAGDSKLSQLYLTATLPGFDFLFAALKDKQVQVSVGRKGEPARILAGEVQLESGESAQLAQCITELIGLMQARHAEKGKK